jgi:hypothetical protein
MRYIYDFIQKVPLFNIKFFYINISITGFKYNIAKKAINLSIRLRKTFAINSYMVKYIN